MASTVRISYFGPGATEQAGTTAETGFKFNREDTLSGTTATIAVPSSTGTGFSWHKPLGLEVTATDSTNISNRKVYMGSAASTGLQLFFKQSASYVQAALAAAATGSNGSTPAGYTLLSTTPQTYDSGSDSAGSTGRSGDFCFVALGVDNTYAGGAGSAIVLPDLKMQYDEA